MTIKEITLEGTHETKTIKFEKDNRVNQNQKNYFNTILNPNLTVKTDYNEFGWFGGFRCAKS